MAFGWSLPKLMVLLTFAVLLFGVPLMALIVTLRDRYGRRTRKGDRDR